MPERLGYNITIDTLNSSHFADLSALRENSRHPMNMSRVSLFRRLGLITAEDPPRPASGEKTRRGPKRRAYKLTPIGERVEAENRHRAGQVSQVGWGG